jgi:hypothetical protein
MIIRSKYISQIKILLIFQIKNKNSASLYRNILLYNKNQLISKKNQKYLENKKRSSIFVEYI